MADTETATPAVEFDEVTGQIRFGDLGTLRPPNFGEMRQLEELMERAEAVKDEAKEAAGEAWVEPTQMQTWAENLTWWRLAFTLLGTKELPPEEQCPIWLGTVALIIRARNHWVSFPIPALGNTLAQLLGAGTNGSA